MDELLQTMASLGIDLKRKRYPGHVRV